MPEHIHLLTNEPAVGTLATFLLIFKQLTSRQLKFSTGNSSGRAVLTTSTFTLKRSALKICSILLEPVQRGLVLRPEDYRWSSFDDYATDEPGLVEIECKGTARRRERERHPWTTSVCLHPTLRKDAKDGAPGFQPERSMELWVASLFAIDCSWLVRVYGERRLVRQIQGSFTSFRMTTSMQRGKLGSSFRSSILRFLGLRA